MRGKLWWRLLDWNYQRWLRKHSLEERAVKQIKEELNLLSYNPKISIIMPVYNIDKIWLEKAIESVKCQIYPNWELCVVDDSSTNKHIRKVLERYQIEDKRIKIRYLSTHQGISGASNDALILATGEFVGFLDHDDELTPDALFEVAKLLNRHPDADMIYSDEDKLTPHGKRTEPSFKSGWSPDLFLSTMYTCHLGVYRRSIIEEIDGLREGYEGSQDYDLVLRLTEKTENIYHIPKILYHWRKVIGSAAFSSSSKRYAYNAGGKALNDMLRRRNIDGEIQKGTWLGTYRVKRRIISIPKVSIIISISKKYAGFNRYLTQVLQKIDYNNYELIIISEQKCVNNFPSCKLYVKDEPFSLPKFNNYGVQKAKGEYLLFMHPMVEPINDEWLTSMLEQSQREEVGTVGALISRPDGSVYHAGIILGGEGVIYSHRGFPFKSVGKFGLLKLIRNYSAVSGLCMMAKRDKFEKIEGFNEDFRVSFYDVDLCLRLRKKGFLIVYTPYAQLYYYGLREDKCERDRLLFTKRWGEALGDDPYYNPNFSFKNGGFELNI
ncbi:glycosyltransferase [candidate division WOR-3 bacterium]|nr:glycosyltransferase [candidate division WOR-3 bacterium]